MKKITFVIYSMCIGGTEKVTRDLINEFIKREYIVDLICLQKSGVFLEQINLNSENIYELGTISTIKSFFKRVIKLNKILKNIKPDIVLSMGEWPNIITPFSKYRKKTVLVEHSTKTFFTSPQQYNLNFIFTKITKLAYTKAQMILCVSEHIKDNLLEKNISFKNKTYVIYNPIDFSLIKKLSSESIGYVTDKIKLISVGRLQKEKNIKMLISVINELKGYNIELWIIGDGDEKEKLTEYVNILNLNNIIKFMGFQNNPYKYINAADILISSSDYEGFGLVIFEALALKKRVITTRSISDFDTIITEELGRVVPINNPDSLKKAIEKEIFEAKIISSEPEIIKQFTISNVTDNYINFFDYITKK